MKSNTQPSSQGLVAVFVIDAPVFILSYLSISICPVSLCPFSLSLIPAARIKAAFTWTWKLQETQGLCSSYQILYFNTFRESFIRSLNRRPGAGQRARPSRSSFSRKKSSAWPVLGYVYMLSVSTFSFSLWNFIRLLNFSALVRPWDKILGFLSPC